MFGLFKKKKKRISVVHPPPVGDLPSFPSPEEIEDFAQNEPEPPEPPRPLSVRRSRSVPKVLSQVRLSAPSMMSDKSIAVPEPHISDDMTRPVFLKAELFNSVLHDITTVRSRLDKSSRMVARLEEVHDSQSHLLNDWHNTIKDMHDKLLFVDGVLFKRG